MATDWELSGDYFENCNCSVVCPCLISPAPPLTSRPSQGQCDVVLAFHIDKGSYGAVGLDGLNLALIGHTPGAMADGNWTIAIYIDERASDEQTAALGAVFGGAEGGPMAAYGWRRSRPSSLSKNCSRPGRGSRAPAALRCWGLGSTLFGRVNS